MMLRLIAASATPPRGVLLAPGIALIMMSGPDQSAGAPAISFRGRPLPAPHGMVTVETDPNVVRIAAVRLPANQQDDLPLLVQSASGEHMPLHLSELNPDPLAIAAGLDGPARWRLLEFLLNFCCAAFRLGTTPTFAQMCIRLAVDCTRHAGIVTVEAQVLAGRVLLSGMTVPSGSTLCVLRRTSVVHSTTRVLEMGHLQIVPQAASGDLIIASGLEPIGWTVDEPPVVPHVLALPEVGRIPGALARAACRQALVRGLRKGVAADFLRDMDFLHPAPIRKVDDLAQPICGEIELAIPDDEGGMFLAGWLRDPLGMIGSMELATDLGRVALEADSMVRLPRPDITKRFASAAHRGGDAKAGFVAFVSDLNSGHTVQPHLLLRLKSGSRIELTPAPRSLGPAAARDIVLGCVPSGLVTAPMMQKCIAPAAARLHRTAMRTRDPIEVIQIGKRVAKPVASILIPLYRNIGFLRFQVAALSEDPDCRRSDIIYILDSPEQRNEVEHLLRGLHRTTELATTLVIMPRNLGYAAANNAGATEARGAILLLLNSDVIPIAPGWLRTLLEPFSRAAVGAAGPKLLFEDGSIQHAGLYFERDEDDVWFNRHYHKGMPRGWAEAQVRREVPGVTGAALAIRRKVFEQIGGVCEDYIIGDYEDSDLCLRARVAGHSIIYVPEVELYHFERRSIGLHAGYMRTHASLYNRLLHHERWNDAMTALMIEATPARRRRA
jgi:O-antigen biosynthesis protein